MLVDKGLAMLGGICQVSGGQSRMQSLHWLLKKQIYIIPWVTEKTCLLNRDFREKETKRKAHFSDEKRTFNK